MKTAEHIALAREQMTALRLMIARFFNVGSPVFENIENVCSHLAAAEAMLEQHCGPQHCGPMAFGLDIDPASLESVEIEVPDRDGVALNNTAHPTTRCSALRNSGLTGDVNLIVRCEKESGHAGRHVSRDQGMWTQWVADIQPTTGRKVADHAWEDQQAEEIRALRAVIGALLPYAERDPQSEAARAVTRFALEILGVTKRVDA